MYINSLLPEQKEKYIELIDRIKKENREVKRVIYSKEIRIGTYICDIRCALFGKKKISSILDSIRQSYRWRKLCKKYPIRHDNQKAEAAISNYFSDEKIIIYTAIFGRYDNALEPVIIPDNCEFVLITDQDVSSSSAWRLLKPESVIPDYDYLSNAEKNRYCKMFPYKIFKDVRFTIYIDGNIKPVTDLTEFVNHNYDFGMQFHRHKSRNCVYEELEACRILRKANVKSIHTYGELLRRAGFPRNYGMVECNVIVRDNSCKIMRDIMGEWWQEFHTNEVKRDQLTMPYLLWKYKINISDVSDLGDNVEENDAIRVVSHAY